MNICLLHFNAVIYLPVKIRGKFGAYLLFRAVNEGEVEGVEIPTLWFQHKG